MDTIQIEKITPRFWTFVEKQNECWLWKGTKTTTGYGDFRYGHASRIKAHRFSFLLDKGYLPTKFVLHVCDTPLCVNPKHLYEGTPKENSQDMIKKGRHSSQKRIHCPKGHNFSKENTYIHKNGSRRCKQCHSDYYQRIKKH